MPFWRRIRDLPPLGRLVLFLALLVAVLSIDWQPAPRPPRPRLVEDGHASGSIQAGVGRASLAPPFPVPIAGLDARPTEPSEGILNPLAVRALTIEVGGRRIALVSAELVLIPAALRGRVLKECADLRLSELVIVATHTHSGPGAFWNNRAAGFLGAGSFDPRMEAFLVTQTVAALHSSVALLHPALFSSAVVEAANFASNRNDARAPIDNRLTVARFTDAKTQQPLANIVIYAAHPTVEAPDDNRLSGDWPGALMSSLESETGATTLLFQGAVGDVTWAKRRGEMTRQERAVRVGQELATEARGAAAAAGPGEPTASLNWARVEWGLPSCDLRGAVPWPLDGMTSNLFCWLTGIRTAEVTVVQLADLQLGFIPGEVVASLGMAWRAESGLTVVSLADGYIGAIESPNEIEAGRGEAPHSWFGPRLAPAVHAALLEARARSSAVPH